MRKIISLVLALVMMLSMGVSVSAGTTGIWNLREDEGVEVQVETTEDGVISFTGNQRAHIGVLESPVDINDFSTTVTFDKVAGDESKGEDHWMGFSLLNKKANFHDGDPSQGEGLVVLMRVNNGQPVFQVFTLDETNGFALAFSVLGEGADVSKPMKLEVKKDENDAYHFYANGYQIDSEDQLGKLSPELFEDGQAYLGYTFHTGNKQDMTLTVNSINGEPAYTAFGEAMTSGEAEEDAAPVMVPMGNWSLLENEDVDVKVETTDEGSISFTANSRSHIGVIETPVDINDFHTNLIFDKVAGDEANGVDHWMGFSLLNKKANFHDGDPSIGEGLVVLVRVNGGQPVFQVFTLDSIFGFGLAFSILAEGLDVSQPMDIELKWDEEDSTYHFYANGYQIDDKNQLSTLDPNLFEDGQAYLGYTFHTANRQDMTLTVNSINGEPAYLTDGETPFSSVAEIPRQERPTEETEAAEETDTAAETEAAEETDTATETDTAEETDTSADTEAPADSNSTVIVIVVLAIVILGAGTVVFVKKKKA